MLNELRIENFAIIDQLELQFGQGLAVFTGETGAGKSIIIDALETVLGNRADTTLIRSGSERASVEATFALSAAVRTPIHALLEAEDLLDDPNYVTLGRELRANGRNVARVNGRSVNLSLLHEIGEYLVDIHGQSQHLSLLRVREHLGLLDGFADTAELQDAYRQSYKQLQTVRRELDALRKNERDAARRADLLTYQVEEIDGAHLKIGEETDLREERTRLANAEGLANLSQQALEHLDDGNPESPAISDLLGEVVNALNNLARIDASQANLSAQANTIFEETTDLSRALRIYLEGVEFNPKRLEQVEERLDLIHSLKRKYGDSIEAILAVGEQARQDLDSITHAEERLQELQTQQEKLLAQLAERGLALSQKRRSAAEQLAQSIETELDDLRMAGARFQVDFARRPDPQGIPLPEGERVTFDATGLESVEFLVETNPGEGFKPLVKIASGGETARLMLALKNVLAQADHVPTLIFDEIDQGIGGRVGTVVGHKLWQLTNRHQVLCITHLPQLAAFGQQHFQVQKQIEDGRTTTSVTLITGEARLNELAQMLGEVSLGTLKSAQEILQSAQNLSTHP
ncbi:MAG TPA: DNA repair protein RecN [Chloroflexi bacterium]|nr:DNA repair protein RecN [Chloroflexota bacterium]